MRSFLSVLWSQVRNIDVSVYPKHIVYSIPFDHEPRGVLEKLSVENNRMILIFRTEATLAYSDESDGSSPSSGATGGKAVVAAARGS
jgi:hypothetical protein